MRLIGTNCRKPLAGWPQEAEVPANLAGFLREGLEGGLKVIFHHCHLHSSFAPTLPEDGGQALPGVCPAALEGAQQRGVSAGDTEAPAPSGHSPGCQDDRGRGRRGW